MVLSAPGKAMPQATGLSGGYPAGTQYDVLIRNTPVRTLLANGTIPSTLEECGGVQEIVPSHLETQLATEIVPGDEACFRNWRVVG
jgi:N-methylhydantoinase B